MVYFVLNINCSLECIHSILNILFPNICAQRACAFLTITIDWKLNYLQNEHTNFRWANAFVLKRHSNTKVLLLSIFVLWYCIVVRSIIWWLYGIDFLRVCIWVAKHWRQDNAFCKTRKHDEEKTISATKIDLQTQYLLSYLTIHSPCKCYQV